MNLSYCNASIGDEMDIVYNEVTHTITSGNTSGFDCSTTPLGYGDVIFEHEDGSFRYSVRAKNTSPYAYVTSELIESCSIIINSATPTNASIDTASDGAILITVTGNGTITYSINDGGSYQSGNNFTGLAPGTYKVRVKNVFFGITCYATATVVVGYNAITCDLVLGNVSTTPGPGGSITVVNYTTTHLDQPVQYRLDAGAWQDSAVFTGLGAGTYSVQIRFKNFTTCTNSRNVTLSSCDILITAVDVIHEQSEFANNGIITITATSSNGPIQYSKDNGSNYQSSNIFYNLAPGSYTVRVKDALPCEAFMSVAVERFKPPHVEFPIANGMRVVITGGPVKDSGPQNFDNTLLVSMGFAGMERSCYKQKYLTSDLVTLQWRSSYDVNTAKIYNSANVLQSTLTVVKKTLNMDKTEALSANFSNGGAGKTQIWFPTGLPSFFEIGQPVTISGQASLNGTYLIEDINVGTGTAAGNIVLIVAKNYTSGTDPLTGTVTVTYDVDPFEIWETVIDWSTLAAGSYYVLFGGTDSQFSAYAAQSEPVETSASLEDHVQLKWRNLESNFLIDYTTGIEHMVRLEGELRWGQPGGDREVMEDSRTRMIKLRGKATRLPQLILTAMPHYLAEKVSLALEHDVLTCNGIEYQCNEDLKVDFPEALDALVNATVTLRAVDFQAENEDDSGDVDHSILELGDGEVMEVEP